MTCCQDYIDCIQVIIKEEYIPPNIEHLPLHITDFKRTTKILELSHYDYTLENKTQSLMEQWKTRRKIIADKLKQVQEDRQASVKEAAANMARLNLASVTYPDDIPTDDEDDDDNNDNDDNSIEDNAKAEEELDPNILRPQVIDGGTRAPLKYHHLKMKHPADLTRLSVFDFDSDTSSPFDNMELKTLNDMELLAEVLEYDRPSAPSPPTPPPPPTTSIQIDQLYPFNTAMPKMEFDLEQHNASIAWYCRPLKPDPVIADIIRELQREINERRANCESPPTSSPSPVPAVMSIPLSQSLVSGAPIIPWGSTQEHLNNPYYILPPSLQTTCERITSMGFPLDRVARACEELGEDNKKIIEYLLMMGQIMDLGFPESKVAKALLDNDFNRDKALDQLIS